MLIIFKGFDGRLWFEVGKKTLALSADTEHNCWEEKYDNDVKVLDCDGCPIEIVNYDEEERELLKYFDKKLRNKINNIRLSEFDINKELEKILPSLQKYG